MSEYYFWSSNILLRKDAEKVMNRIAPAIVGFCRTHSNDGLPSYPDDLAPFEMTLESLLRDFDLELVDHGTGHLWFACLGNGFYMEPFDHLLRLIAPLLRNGSTVSFQSADDRDSLYLYKLIKGEWKFRSKWRPVFSGNWNPI